MKQELLNRVEMGEIIFKLFTDYAEEYFPEHCFEDLIDEYAAMVTDDICRSMNKYAHRSDTNIPGNFKDISLNYKWEHDGQEWSEVLAKADAGQLTYDEEKALQDWCAEWFFEAFGTWGLTYNFGELLSNEVYEMECEDAA